MTDQEKPDKAAALAFAMKRLADGHGTLRKPKQRAFTENPAMERLAADVEAGRIDPPASVRMSLGYYQSDKQHQEKGN